MTIKRMTNENYPTECEVCNRQAVYVDTYQYYSDYWNMEVWRQTYYCDDCVPIVITDKE